MTTQLADQLKGLAGRITPGEWLYRPEPEYDGWGILRMAPDAEGWRPVIMQACDPRYINEECLSEHRRAKTDPWQANAEFIALARNNLPAIIAALEEVGRLKARLISEREENLWNAYHTGDVKDGRWTHMYMSDGEWLAQECGFDSRLPEYPDDEIRAAIPIAATRVALGDAV